jgi:hypothetical protein
MPSFVFGLADLIAGTVAAVKVDAYQPNETGEWMEVDSVQIVDLPANPDNAAEYLWTTELIDPTLSVRFAPVSAAGVHLTHGGVILPPQPTEPGVFNLYVDTVTLGMGIADGLIFASAPVGSYVVAGQKLGAALASVKTGAAPWPPGHAELTPPADVGNIRVTLTRIDGPVTERVIEVIVDTTGLEGQSINFATLLPAPV